MAEPLDVDEMRQTLARVSTYRRVTDAVHASSGRTILGGLFYLGLGYVLYNTQGGFTPIIVGFLALGVGELVVGLWKRIAPSPECILMDAILEFGFVVYLAFRVTNGFAIIPKRADPFFVIIGLWALFNGYQHLQSYFRLRKVLVERPTSEHLAYVDDLSDEIAAGDPHTDPAVIELPTKPRLKGKLLGDVAFFYDYRSKELFLCARDEMRIDRRSSSDEPQGVLTILQQQFPPFPLDSATWNNYVAWKTAGGDPPPR